MSTSYVKTQVQINENILFYIDGNSKITVENGTYDEPKPNALSLPHISTCPGATNECMSSCYVFGLQKAAPEIYKEYCKNEQMLHRVLMSNKQLINSSFLLGEWITNNCQDGFRWHVSGDIMNDRHAKWINKVCLDSPKIRHWIYTRSFSIINILNAPNLAVNLSVDAENYEIAKNYKTENNRFCYMTRDGNFPNDLPKGSVIFPDYGLRGRDLDNPTDHSWWKGLSNEYRKMVCPADFFGQSEKHRCGPCKKCLFPNNKV
jgi:hypothetical protein